MSQVLYAERSGYHVLKFVGDVRLSLSPMISGFLSQMQNTDDCLGVVVDLSETETIDSTALGLIAKLGIICRDSFAQTLSIVSPKSDIISIDFETRGTVETILEARKLIDNDEELFENKE